MKILVWLKNSILDNAFTNSIHAPYELMLHGVEVSFISPELIEDLSLAVKHGHSPCFNINH